MTTTHRFSAHKYHHGSLDPKVIVALVVLAALLVALFAYLMFSDEDKTTATPTTAPPPPVTSKQARPDNARELIKELKEQAVPDYAAALEQAREFRAAGQLADAQLVYFFAARGGFAPAAFELGEMYDPAYFDPATSLMDEPDPFQAYRWYVQAQQAGNEDAGQRLADLQNWATEAAASGNTDAERLLLQWENGS